MKSLARLGALAALAVGALPLVSHAVPIQVNATQSAEAIFDLTGFSNLELGNYQWLCGTPCSSDIAQAVNSGGSYASSALLDELAIFTTNATNNTLFDVVGQNFGLSALTGTDPVVKLRFDYVDDVFSISSVNLRFWLLDDQGARIRLEDLSASDIRSVAPASVPVPTSALLILTGLAGLGSLTARKLPRQVGSS